MRIKRRLIDLAHALASATELRRMGPFEWKLFGTATPISKNASITAEAAPSFDSLTCSVFDLHYQPDVLGACFSPSRIQGL